MEYFFFFVKRHVFLQTVGYVEFRIGQTKLVHTFKYSCLSLLRILEAVFGKFRFDVIFVN